MLVALFFPAFLSGKEEDSSSRKRSGTLILPVLFYAPETKWAGGVAVNYYFRESGSAASSRPSTVMPSITYTQQNQIMSELVADLYWRDEAYHLLAYIGYKKFPDKFYGIGRNTPQNNEENYTPQSAKVRVSIQKQIHSGLNAGIQYEFERNKLVEVDPDGLLAQGDILGGKGGIISGFGLLLNRDNRDNIFYPTSGSYWQFTATRFNSALGSDYDFTRYNVDIRQYLSLSSSHILALQGYLNIITGEPPFQKMSMLGDRVGGSNLMRGYVEGRYRDKHMMTFQIEYRFMPVWWKFGLVAFAAAGDVSDKIGDFFVQDFKYVMGGGIRFLINRKEKLNIRLDLAYGKDTSGMYITIGEAF